MRLSLGLDMSEQLPSLSFCSNYQHCVAVLCGFWYAHPVKTTECKVFNVKGMTCLGEIDLVCMRWPKEIDFYYSCLTSYW